MPGHKHAVFSPENGGYLRVGQRDRDWVTHVVWSISDKKLYMRCKEPPTAHERESGKPGSPVKQPLKEVMWYQDQPGVPKLVFSESHKHLKYRDPSHENFRSIVSIWSHCK